MFNYSVNNDLLSDGDTYEYYLKILDDLTFQEIEILFALNEFEINTFPGDNHRHTILSTNKKFWKEFEDLMLAKFDINRNSLDSYLIRIERTGCLYFPRLNSNNLGLSVAMTTDIFKNPKDCLINSSKY